MSSSVKRSRAYDSSRRQAQARQTRVAILDAARVQFLERGYAATTIGDIAAAVGVSVETVYKAFGNKAGLLKAMFDVAIVGDDAPIPFQERDVVARIRAERDGRKKFEIYGNDYAERAERAVPCSCSCATRQRRIQAHARCSIS
jgi:AcrR family transcriptional regulator